MIEGYARYPMVQRCDDEDMALFIKKNGEWERKMKHLGFITYTDKFMVYDKGFAKKMVHQPKNSPLRLACALFVNKGDMIAQALINERYDGDWCKAIESTKKFNVLFDEFLDYFDYRRKKFMEKYDELIAKGVEEGKITPRKNPVPTSYGGVANLLKVLTKTMYEQGSSIRTIAKVQYSICLQSGVYLPDEFITDVLVASDMCPDIFVEGSNEKQSN